MSLKGYEGGIYLHKVGLLLSPEDCTLEFLDAYFRAMCVFVSQAESLCETVFRFGKQ